VTGLSRTLGPLQASAIGVASMVGAGVFYVFAPAAALAGSWVLLALLIAGSLALLNTLTMAQLSLHNPVSGGAYSFGTRYVSPGVGFLAGWLFLAGKTASVAAIALIASRYISAEHAPIIAAGLVAVFAVVNISGIRTTAWVSMAIALVVVVSLLSVVGVSFAGWGLSGGQWGTSQPGSVYGVLQASSLLFFAFAGYARMATLGEEVRNPGTVLPRVIIGTLAGVEVLYALVGFALVWVLGADGLAESVAPVAQLVPGSLSGAVAALAVLASLGSLMTVMAALSRVSLAMARDKTLPGALARVWSRTSTPAVAELSMAACAVVCVLFVDPQWLVGASAGSVLLYYAIAHQSAIAQPAGERVIWRGIPYLGLAGCVIVVATLPPLSLLTTLVIAGSGAALWALVLRRRKFAR